MALSAENKQELLGVIKQMTAKGESRERVQQMVNAYKAKFDVPEQLEGGYEPFQGEWEQPGNAPQLFQEEQPEQISTTAGTTQGMGRDEREAALPRATSGTDQSGLGGMLDLLSMPGRAAAAALFQGDQESFLEAMQRVKAPQEAGWLSSMAENMLRDPSSPTMAIPGLGMGAKALSTGGKMAQAAKLGAAGMGESALSAGIHQSDLASQGKETSLTQFGLESLAGGVLPVGLKYTGEGFKKLAPKIKAAVLKGEEKVINPALKSISSELSGISEEAIEIATTKKGRTKLIKMAGKGKEIGSGLLDILDNIDNNYQYESQLNTALEVMPDIPTKEVVSSLKSSMNKLGEMPHEQAAKGKIKEYMEALTREFGTAIKEVPFVETKAISSLDAGLGRFSLGKSSDLGGGKMLTAFERAMKDQGVDISKRGVPKPKMKKGHLSAKNFRKLRQRLDYAVDFREEGSDLFNNALKNARTKAKDNLISSADGTPYAETMKNYAEMLTVRDNIYKNYIGRKGEIRNKRIESFTNNLYGKNKGDAQKMIGDIDRVFGKDFSKDIKLSHLANQMVKEGKIPFFASQTTGRSAKGEIGALGQIGVGMYTGSPIPFATAAGTVALSSPKLAPRVIQGSRGLAEGVGTGLEKPTGLAGDIMSNQYLQRTIPGLARQPFRGEQ